MNITLEFRTTAMHGVLLGISSAKVDAIGLEIVNGKVGCPALAYSYFTRLVKSRRIEWLGTTKESPQKCDGGKMSEPNPCRTSMGQAVSIKVSS